MTSKLADWCGARLRANAASGENEFSAKHRGWGKLTQDRHSGTSDLPSGAEGGKDLRLEEIKAKALLTQKWRGLFTVALRERWERTSITVLPRSLRGLQHVFDYTAKGKTCARPTSRNHKPQPQLSEAVLSPSKDANLKYGTCRLSLITTIHAKSHAWNEKSAILTPGQTVVAITETVMFINLVMIIFTKDPWEASRKCHDSSKQPQNVSLERQDAHGPR